MTSENRDINSPFNESFCIQLEYRLCGEFEKSNDSELSQFWCDGVSWSPNLNELSLKKVSDTRKIETKAWIGKTGQEIYQATIIFGKKSLSRYARGLDLSECIPDIHSKEEWIEIDTDKKIISIQLK